MEIVSNIIEAKSIYKAYQSSNFKIEDLNLSFKEGKITGLVGKNGSGKTTIMKILVGLLPPDKGNIKILGLDIKSEFEKINRNIGYMHAEHHFYDYLTGREFLRFVGKVKGVDNKELFERIQNYSNHFELDDILDTTIINYSHGTKQKISFISQIINHPKLLVLDEPLNGLDPIMIKKMRDFIKNLAIKYNMCIIVSAHQLSFIQEICDTIIVINNGRMLMNKEISESNLRIFEEDIINVLEKGSN